MKGGTSEKGWLAAYLPAAWAGHVCQVNKFLIISLTIFGWLKVGALLLYSVVFIPLSLSTTIRRDDDVCPCQGLAMGILGPTQPYLAKQVSNKQFWPIYASYTIQRMMMIIMLVIMIMCLPRWVCPTTRSALSGLAVPLVTAWRPLSPALSSGYLAP